MSKILTSLIKTCTSSTSNNFADKILKNNTPFNRDNNIMSEQKKNEKKIWKRKQRNIDLDLVQCRLKSTLFEL